METVVWMLGGMAIGSVVFLVVKWIMTPQDKAPLAPKDLFAPKDKVEYCQACGSRKILHQGQSGYNAKTGLPSLLTYLACPDWDEKTWDARRSARMVAAFDYETPPRDCENRVFVPVQATYAHKGHADGDVLVECARCIIDMERAEIISHEDADRRLKEIA